MVRRRVLLLLNFLLHMWRSNGRARMGRPAKNTRRTRREAELNSRRKARSRRQRLTRKVRRRRRRRNEQPRRAAVAPAPTLVAAAAAVVAVTRTIKYGPCGGAVRDRGWVYVQVCGPIRRGTHFHPTRTRSFMHGMIWKRAQGHGPSTTCTCRLSCAGKSAGWGGARSYSS